MSEGWAHTSVYGAAGRRRHYNAMRQLHARLRQGKELRYLLDHGLSLTEPGTQRRLAEAFGVHPSTISRDLRAIFARHPG
jgi:hypothetical protein